MSLEEQPWEQDGEESWRSHGSDWHRPAEVRENWRGEVHLRDWPEELAGPEYWLYKRMRDE